MARRRGASPRASCWPSEGASLLLRLFRMSERYTAGMAKQVWLDACALARGDEEITGEAKRALFASQRGKCWWCEKPLKPKKDAPPFPPEKALDAKLVLNIPLVENGKWWPSNIRMVCPKCAVEKEERDRARQGRPRSRAAMA